MSGKDTIIDTLRDRSDEGESSERDTIAIQVPEIRELGFVQRYERARQLGEGGMGEVTLFRDQQIGRKVALKVLKPNIADNHEARERFLREARVQGQLEHPAIVPVYDLGVTPHGQFYFTMKRVHGQTLAEIIEYRHDEHTDLEGRYALRRLLNAFISVCFAVAYAHERGVIHRDLKPGNIMLGSYGEVYVLDWGLARISEEAASTIKLELQDEGRKATVLGTILGTPGYMSPEQFRGEHDTLTAASDIYSLGAILFEILSTRRLDPRKRPSEMIEKNLRKDPDAMPVPAGLVAVLDRATAADAADRYPNARALAFDVEQYLDGARDEARRREQAARFAEQAALAARTGGYPERRAALQQLGRALALDPQNRVATRTLVNLLSEPPEELPAELEETLREAADEQRRDMGRLSTFVYGAFPLFLPFLLWLGIIEWWPILLLYAFNVLAVVFSLATWRGWIQPQAGVYTVMVLSNLCFAMTATFFGPLFLTPMLIIVNTAAFMLQVNKTERIVGVVIGCTSLVLPVMLGLVGVLPGGYTFADGQMQIVPGALAVEPVGTVVFMTLVCLTSLLLAAFIVASIRAAVIAGERRQALYAWHMRELISARPGDMPTTPGLQLTKS